MDFESIILLVCYIFVAIGFLVVEVNWQWKGFDKLKKALRKKGCK